MSFLSRETIDKVLPNNHHLEAKARKIVRIPNGKDARPLEAFLLWLADHAVEPISVTFDDEWYMQLKHSDTYIYGKSLTLIVLRTVVIVQCRVEWLKIPPDERPDFVMQLQEFMRT